jgi:hypothetical protein
VPVKATYRGSCHCGAVSAEIGLTKPADETLLRACQCSFCRRRGTRTVADPNGLATLSASSPDHLIRYRFGFKTADYLLCKTCGTYIAAVLETDGQRLGVVNVGGLDVAEFRGRAGNPVDYDGETQADRMLRRREKWMPVEFRWGGG